MNNIQKLIKVGAIALAIIIIISIFSLVVSGVSWLFDINIFNNKDITNFKEVYEEVSEIEIDAVASTIEITSGRELKVEAKNLENNLISRVRNGMLEIEEKGNWFNTNKSNGIIYITIPKDITLNKLSLDTGAGKIIVKDINVSYFDIDHGAGILEISNSKFSKTDIDGGAGLIKIKKSTLNNLELDAGAGKVKIEASITGSSEISCGVGEMDINLIGTSDDYQITTFKGIGTIKIDNLEQKNESVYGTGRNKLEIEGGIGNIDISFIK